MTLRDAILAALDKLGVKTIGSEKDLCRWSPGDLATDLADELKTFDVVKAERDRVVDVVRHYLVFNSQRAVSWHEIQDCIKAIKEAK